MIFRGPRLADHAALIRPATSLLPLLPGWRPRARRGVGTSGRSRRCCFRRRRSVVTATKNYAARVAVKVVHGAADVGERAAAVGHQRAGALVEILGEVADRL